MNHYCINTEARYLEYSPHETWIEHNLAFTSGNETYGKKLGKLEPNDICFMYANEYGVVAVGRVLCHWDYTGHEGNQRIIYCAETEYRISVKRFIRLDHNPIRPADLKDIIGYQPVQTLQRITKPGAAEQLLKLAEEHSLISRCS